MLIKLSPARDDRTLEIIKQNETLTINGESFDFSQLTDGATLPQKAIDCLYINGDVARINSELIIPILLPHGPNASEAARFPKPITVTEDGPIVLPE